MRRGDYLVMAIVLALALAFGLGAFLSIGEDAEKTLVIRVNGEEQQRLLLLPGAPMEQIVVESQGFHLTIELQDGQARVAQADCPDGVCVHAGWISRPGAVAVCVPARVSIAVEGGGPAPDVVLQ